MAKCNREYQGPSFPEKHGLKCELPEEHVHAPVEMGFMRRHAADNGDDGLLTWLDADQKAERARQIPEEERN